MVLQERHAIRALRGGGEILPVFLSGQRETGSEGLFYRVSPQPSAREDCGISQTKSGRGLEKESQPGFLARIGCMSAPLIWQDFDGRVRLSFNIVRSAEIDRWAVAGVLNDEFGEKEKTWRGIPDLILSASDE